MIKRRKIEERIWDVLNYIIDNPNCHLTHICQHANLSHVRTIEYILQLQQLGFIKYYHIKSLRRCDNLIVITRKGIEIIYGGEKWYK
jgi:predicted transcriptional regulator